MFHNLARGARQVDGVRGGELRALHTLYPPKKLRIMGISILSYGHGEFQEVAMQIRASRRVNMRDYGLLMAKAEKRGLQSSSESMRSRAQLARLVLNRRRKRLAS